MRYTDEQLGYENMTWAEIGRLWIKNNYCQRIIQVSREQLRLKVEIVLMTQGDCQIHWNN